MIYPCATSAVYYLSALGFTAFSLSRNEKVIKLKFYLAILFTLVALGFLVTKGFFLIKLNNEGEITLTPEERTFYDSMGIRIDQS